MLRPYSSLFVPNRLPGHRNECDALLVSSVLFFFHYIFLSNMPGERAVQLPLGEGLQQEQEDPNSLRHGWILNRKN